jgi:uncharacterized protein involved in exopolysaccharide biosynthesis
VLRVTVTWENSFKTQHLVAAVTERYLATQREARQEALQRVAAWLREQIEDLQSRGLEIEGSIGKLKAKSGLSDTTAHQNITDQQISELNIN